MTILAQDLADRWGIPRRGLKVLMAWMQARKIERITDLMRYGKKHSEAMDNALTDFWKYATE